MKYAIFVSFSENIIQEFIPFLNSIDYFNHDLDVIVMYQYTSEEMLKRIKEVDWSFNLKLVPLEADKDDPRKDKMKYVAVVYRFKKMAEMGKKYDACVMLDADMILLSNITDILEASIGKNIYGAKEPRHIYFDNKDCGSWVDFDGKPLAEKTGHYWNNICAVPLFMNVKEHHDVLEKVVEYCRNTEKDDYQLLNLAIHQLGKSKYVIPMRNSLWIGTQMSWFKEPLLEEIEPDKHDTRFKEGHCIRAWDDMLVRTWHSHWWHNPKIVDTLPPRFLKIYREKWKELTGFPEPPKEHFNQFIKRKLKQLETVNKQFKFFYNNGKFKI